VTDLLSIGECMVELSRHADGRFSLAYGGDTFNTAVYAARLGLAVAYGTALGDDPYSRGIYDLAAAEAVDMASVAALPGRVPGLYVIETDARGERRFYYWRDSAPARGLFETANPALERQLGEAACLYFSGITLSLYSPAGLDRFAGHLEAARRRGATIAFDGNFRPRGWGGDIMRARSTFLRFLPLVSLALPTFDDEQALWGDTDPQATIERLASQGVSEIVVKNGAAGVSVLAGGERGAAAIPEPVTPVDTTAAGDSFNAGYLAGRRLGRDWREAAVLGHRLAGRVIRERGAILPKAATAGLV